MRILTSRYTQILVFDEMVNLTFGRLSSTPYAEIMFAVQELGIDTNLYALVFGESVLNDAVCCTSSLTLSPSTPG